MINMLVERLLWSDDCNSMANCSRILPVPNSGGKWGEGGEKVFNFYENSILSLTELPYFTLLPTSLHSNR